MSISYLPVWKKDATPAERFSEFESIARNHPERFGKLVVLYEETLPNSRTILRKWSDGCTTNELLGLLSMSAVEIVRDSQ